MDFPLIVGAVIVAALLFDFLNGFNDAANAIATVVATRVLTPGQAVVWAAFFNFVSAFAFGTAVAKTIGSGMVRTDLITQHAVLSGVLAAIGWTWLATHWGLPISASHALIGGFGGAAMVHVGLTRGWAEAPSALIPSGWTMTLLFIVVAPLLGFITGGGLMVAVAWIFRRATPRRVDKHFRRLQLVSSGIFSFAHGTNDAQKTMGIITGALVAGGVLPTFDVPLWVILSAHTAIALGTLLGGWRVIRTMGDRITKLKPVGGFCAETGGGFSVLLAAYLGAPASTTHTIAGAIAGVGAVRRVRAVRWGNVTTIVWAWVFTIPTTLVVGGLVHLIVHTTLEGR